MSAPTRPLPRGPLRRPSAAVFALLSLGLLALWAVPPATRRSLAASGVSDFGPSDSGEILTTHSESGQFIVAGPKSISLPRSIESRSVGVTSRTLTPPTLAVSCERVKDEILRILDLQDQWRQAGGARTGRILVQIDPLFPTNSAPAVQANPFEDGWHFRLPLPRSLEQDVLVRTLTHAVLLEIASRQGNQRSPEIPLWLVEGMTQSVLANVPEGVILQPQSRLTADLRVAERLAAVRDLLARKGALNFHELSQPDLSKFSREDWDRYSACAHLLLHELMRREGGVDRTSRFLRQSQAFWNWQTGLVDAFQPEFRSLLDVEKWWALTVANYTGRTPAQAWPAEFALRKLDEALQPVGILPGAGNQAGRLSVDTVIAEWDYPRQVPVLREVLRQLAFIRANAPADIHPLAHRYADLLETYLATRSRAGFAPATRSQPMQSVKLLARETVSRFRALQGERAALSQRINAVASADRSP